MRERRDGVRGAVRPLSATVRGRLRTVRCERIDTRCGMRGRWFAASLNGCEESHEKGIFTAFSRDFSLTRSREA